MSTLARVFRIALITCVALVVIGVVVTMAYVFAPQFLRALNLSRQNKTMVLMRDAAVVLEHGKPVGVLYDAWGYPLQVRVAGKHYSIRSAGSDGRFENTAPRGAIEGFEADLVFSEGAFVQYAEGI